MANTPTPPTGGSIPTPDTSKGLKRFLAETSREMKKVNWPTKKETNRLTGVVLAVCGLLVLILSIMSFAFGTIVNLLTKGG
jgi:preprotein translocase subunit SecE